MRNYIFKQFSHFSHEDFWSRSAFIKAIAQFLIWFIPAVTTVYVYVTYYPKSDFLCGAVSEGIGPNLWNLIGSLGLVLFGFTVILSNYCKYFAQMTEKVLSSTFAIGSLTFGLIFGQWIFLLANNNLIWWKLGFLGVTSGFLLIIVFIYNLFVWYLKFLVTRENKQKSPFLISLERMNFIWRFLLGVLLILLMFFLFNKHLEGTGKHAKKSEGASIATFCNAVSKKHDLVEGKNK